MFCKNCGSQITDGVKFCTNCGTVMVQATTTGQMVTPTVPPMPQQTVQSKWPVLLLISLVVPHVIPAMMDFLTLFIWRIGSDRYFLPRALVNNGLSATGYILAIYAFIKMKMTIPLAIKNTALAVLIFGAIPPVYYFLHNLFILYHYFF
jgi:hypothetical protein